MKISVQAEDFSLQEENDRLLYEPGKAGAVVTFTGLVRDYHGENEVSSLVLEHYPGMTEKALKKIAEDAQQRWSLLDLTIIHRVGELRAADQIVLVAVASAHRGDAFSACEFIMDFLKTRAPFWKKSKGGNSEHWVGSRASDDEAAARWTKNKGGAE